MGTTAHRTFAERAGRSLGRAARTFVRIDRRAQIWLAAWGLKPSAARTLSFAVKLVVIGSSLYIAFWLAVLIALVLMATHTAQLTGDDIDKAEWRNGWDGYGLYREGVRIDCGSIDDE